MTPADCQHARRTLEDLLDGYLPAESARATEAHLVACAACAREREGLLALRAALRELPVPEMRPGFADEALAAAAARGGAVMHLPQARERSPAHRWFAKPRRDTWFGAILGAAAAAALVVMLWGVPEHNPEPEAVAPFRIALFEPREIGVAIEATEAMPGATLTISLEGGIDLVGFGERRELSWQADLDPGTNMLSLPIIAHSLENGVLTARVDHGAGTKLISVRVEVEDPARNLR